MESKKFEVHMLPIMIGLARSLTCLDATKPIPKELVDIAGIICNN